MNAPSTPDGRYIIVRGRLWRASNPALPEAVRRALVDELMGARRAVKTALAEEDPAALKLARRRVQAAKEKLGERGAIWWDDGAADLNRHMIANTPYTAWWQASGHDT